MQFLIPLQYKAAAGIYAIQNSINECVYVGQAANFKTRYSVHRSSLMAGTHHAPRLQELVNLHGIDICSFVLLEVVSPGKDIGLAEQRWIHETKAHLPAHGFNGVGTAKSKILKEEEIRVALSLPPDALSDLRLLAKHMGVGSVASMARNLVLNAIRARIQEMEANCQM